MEIKIEEALKIESELVNQNYGKQGYKLVNSQVGFNSLMKSGKIEERSNKVREARSRKVMHIESGIKYNSVSEMALDVGIERTALQKRLEKIRDNPDHKFNDGITPNYVRIE